MAANNRARDGSSEQFWMRMTPADLERFNAVLASCKSRYPIVTRSDLMRAAFWHGLIAVEKDNELVLHGAVKPKETAKTV